MNRIKVKVCGMRDNENILAVSELDIDMMGFVFWPDSPRFVPMISSQAGIIPDYSEERLASQQNNNLHYSAKTRRIKRVGVFVDDMPQNIITRTYNYGLDYIQLNGNEPRETCENLRSTIDPDIHPGIKIIKTINVANSQDIKQYYDYIGAVDLFLFNIYNSSEIKSSSQPDWNILQSYDGKIPFLLGGGIYPESAAQVKAFQHPQFIGVNLNSTFEDAPAVKNVEQLRLFINELRSDK